MKRYVFHVYDSSDNFITIWKDVINEYSFDEEINSAGGEFRIQLGRNPEDIKSTTDVAFNNKVVVYAIDDDSDALQGKIAFQGRIKNFGVAYGTTDKVEVVLLSIGADLDEYMIDYGDNIIQEFWDNSITYAARNANNYVLAQSFVLTDKTRITSIVLRLKSSDESNVTVSIYSGTPSTYGSGTGYGTIIKRVANTIFEDVTFSFDTPVELDAGTYHFRVEITNHGSGTGNEIRVDNSLNTYSEGALYQCTDSVTDPSQTFALVGGGTLLGAYDLYFKINAGTIQPFYSTDPSNILKKILDYYIAAGGDISYDSNTIDLTNTSVTYRFNTNTVWEGVKKCLELAPPDWYMYIDQETGMLHFHQKSPTPEHSLVLGKNIEQLGIEYRTEDIANEIYFTGEEGFFRKYSNENSISLYGRKVFRYIDQRVSLPETARTIANSLLSTMSSPELRLTVSVIDNANGVHGLDLESLDVGDIVKFRGFGSTTGSIWDQSFWDVAYWDFNAKEIDTLILQIVKIKRAPDRAVLALSTIPPDVTKRIEDINRRLLATDTANNPIVET